MGGNPVQLGDLVSSRAIWFRSDRRAPTGPAMVVEVFEEDGLPPVCIIRFPDGFETQVMRDFLEPWTGDEG